MHLPSAGLHPHKAQTSLAEVDDACTICHTVFMHVEDIGYVSGLPPACARSSQGCSKSQAMSRRADVCVRSCM
jgi:hypothetical protein